MVVTADSVMAVDARIVLYRSDEKVALPAIVPYPGQYNLNKTLTDGTPVVVRPIVPQGPSSLRT